MLIVCPSCATSYDVGPASLSPNGRQVRCARCRTVWRAELSQSDKLFAAAAAIAASGDLAHQAAGATAEQATAAPAAVSAAEMDTFTSSGISPADEQSAEEHPPTSAAFAEPVPRDEGNGTESSGSEVQAPPIVPADIEESQPPIDVPADHALEQADEPPEDVETVAARLQQPRSKRGSRGWPLSWLQTGTLALVLVNIVLIGWRGDVVRVLPQTASFYALLGLPVNLRGLTFNDVATSMEEHDGVPILVVEGNIVNAARKVEDVPHLKFIVRNAARQEIYSWTAVPSRNALGPGEAVSFRARLASPPPDAHDFILRFVNRRDIVAVNR